MSEANDIALDLHLPWQTLRWRYVTGVINDRMDEVAEYSEEAVAQRIVACVNACAGFDSAVLAETPLKPLLASMVRFLDLVAMECSYETEAEAAQAKAVIQRLLGTG